MKLNKGEKKKTKLHQNRQKKGIWIHIDGKQTKESVNSRCAAKQMSKQRLGARHFIFDNERK